MGARDYQHDDPFKRIHWKASARHGDLKARQFESTTSLSLLLVLDVYSFCRPANEEPFELAVTTVASLADEAHREGCPLGLLANSLPEIDIPVHSGRGQLLLVLEALARVKAESRLPVHDQLDRNMSRLPAGTTLVIVTAGAPASVTGLVRKLQRDGHSVALVSIGERAPDDLTAGIPALSVASVADLSRTYAELPR